MTDQSLTTNEPQSMGTCKICGQDILPQQWIHIGGDGKTTDNYHLKCYKENIDV